MRVYGLKLPTSPNFFNGARGVNHKVCRFNVLQNVINAIDILMIFACRPWDLYGCAMICERQVDLDQSCMFLVLVDPFYC